MAEVTMGLQSVDYEEQHFTYVQTKNINEKTIDTRLDISMMLFSSRYIDDSVYIKFDYSLGLDASSKVYFFDK